MLNCSNLDWVNSSMVKIKLPHFSLVSSHQVQEFLFRSFARSSHKSKPLPDRNIKKLKALRHVYSLLHKKPKKDSSATLLLLEQSGEGKGILLIQIDSWLKCLLISANTLKIRYKSQDWILRGELKTMISQTNNQLILKKQNTIVTSINCSLSLRCSLSLSL